MYDFDQDVITVFGNSCTCFGPRHHLYSYHLCGTSNIGAADSTFDIFSHDVIWDEIRTRHFPYETSGFDRGKAVHHIEIMVTVGLHPRRIAPMILKTFL